MLGFKLVCVRQLHGYRIGQEVSDPDLVEKLNSGPHEHFFVRVSLPDKIEDEDAAQPPLKRKPPGADTSNRRIRP
jgi:hypothetical protein